MQSFTKFFISLFLYFFISLFLLGPSLYAQQGVKYNAHPKDLYSHTIQFKFYADFRQAIHDHKPNSIFYSVKNYNTLNAIWNLIPSYEFGYKYKWFFKLQTSCYMNRTNTQLSSDYTMDVTNQLHILNLYVSYNFLPAHSHHTLKLGVGPGFQIDMAKTIHTYLNEEGSLRQQSNKTLHPYFAFGTEVSYQWNFYKCLSVGADVGYMFARAASQGNHFTVGLTLSASFTHR